MAKNVKKWYKKFFEGALLIKGWNYYMKEILKNVPESGQNDVKAKLVTLGEKIAKEWSKENNIRKIDTKMLQAWGNELKSFKKTSIQNDDLAKAIERIDKEVDAALVV